MTPPTTPRMKSLEPPARSARIALSTAFVLAVLVSGGIPDAWGQAEIVVPVPDFTGPIPVTGDSWPLMANDHLQHPADLEGANYVEEEFLITGLANVYDWNGAGISRLTRNAPYTTRILVRRPADPTRSSGRAYVELGNNARRYDWGFSWSLSHEHFLRSGHTWVLVTYASTAIDGLKAFDASRYQSLEFPSTSPQACPPAGAASLSENGLRWDMLSQVSALLRETDGPVGDLGITRVYAMSHGGELPTYVQSVHRMSRREAGGYPFDGFILHRHNRLGTLRDCGSTLSPDDARHVIRDAGVPVIRIVAETDVVGTRALRREDSDEPGDRYRLYEVAGAPHADGAFYRHLPSVTDQESVETQPFLSYWPFAAQCEPEIPIQQLPLMGYVVNAAIENMDSWVFEGVAPPRAERIEIDGGDTLPPSLVTDEFGNVRGGVRTPYVDVPRARYMTTTQGPGGCRNLGWTDPFGWAELERVYGGYDAYREKVSASVGVRVGERWLLPQDGARIRAEVVIPN